MYSTWDWSLVRTMPTGLTAISVAVDPERDYLYYGGGYADNYYLTQRRLSDGNTREVLVDPNAGVLGLGVDSDTGFIYITTGRENRPGGKDLMVYDPNLNVIQMIEDIGRPTGLVIPIHDTSFNPLHLSKTVKNPIGGKADDQGLFYVIIGDLVTYSICFDDGGYDVKELCLADRLPPELAFVERHRPRRLRRVRSRYAHVQMAESAPGPGRQDVPGAGVQGGAEHAAGTGHPQPGHDRQR